MKVRRPNGECLRHVRSTTEIGEGGGGKGCCFFFFFFFFFFLIMVYQKQRKERDELRGS